MERLHTGGRLAFPATCFQEQQAELSVNASYQLAEGRAENNMLTAPLDLLPKYSSEMCRSHIIEV